jgi:hypothetical protein
MKLPATNLAARAGVLAAIFVVTFSGVLIGLHEIAPPARVPQPSAAPSARVVRNLPPTDSLPKKETRETPVEVSGLGWVKDYLGEIGWWSWLAALVVSLGAVIGATPVVKKWLPNPYGRNDALEAPEVM